MIDFYLVNPETRAMTIEVNPVRAIVLQNNGYRIVTEAVYLKLWAARAVSDADFDALCRELVTPQQA